MGRWLSHYMPLWMALALVILPILVGKAVRQTSPAAPSEWPADVVLGLLSFWVWALVTNAHDGRLVRTSGQEEAKDPKQRKEELAVILFFLTLTLAAFLVCNFPVPLLAALLVAFAAMVFPVVVLWRPV